MFKSLIALSLLISLPLSTQAKPCVTQDGKPKLTLPWGTYEAEPYGDNGKIALFKNVRFGKAPVGPLRFAAPQFPDRIRDDKVVQDNSFGPSCIQANLDAENPSPVPGGAEDEDCLFLDIYVPYSALTSPEKLPVVDYIYGGAYLFGGKETVLQSNDTTWSLYDGRGIFDASDNGIIWVVGNYRLGAYGWLAGSTMEYAGTPNAGLHDQRLVLQFIQTYIGQVNGNNDKVSAWGNSAGAGSIIHHLTAFGGEQSPLFQRAALWSPAYQWAWDRQGTLQQTFSNFSKAAGCGARTGSLDCLRQADNKQLKVANQEIVTSVTKTGLFPFGPAVDGSWVKALAARELSRGNFANCSSLIVSHVWNESGIFVKDWVQTTGDFTRFLNHAFPGEKLQYVRDTIEENYPAEGPPFDGDQQIRVRKVLQDSTFVCNSRQVYDAYRGNVYMMQYNSPPATHGSDLIASSWYKGVAIGDLITSYIPKLPKGVAVLIDNLIAPLSGPYQRYFASHAVTGSPNNLKQRGAIDWPTSEDNGNTIGNVLKAGIALDSDPNTGLFVVNEDKESSAENCAFWNDVADEIQSISSMESKHQTTKFGKKKGQSSLLVQTT